MVGPAGARYRPGIRRIINSVRGGEIHLSGDPLMDAGYFHVGGGAAHASFVLMDGGSAPSDQGRGGTRVLDVTVEMSPRSDFAFNKVIQRTLCEETHNGIGICLV